VPARRLAAGTPPAVLLAAFSSALDRLTLPAVLPQIATGLHVSLSGAAATATAYFVAYGGAQLAWSAVSDRIGRVSAMRVALTVAVLAGLVSAVAPTLPVLIASRAVAGACVGGIVPTSLVYIGDTSSLQDRQRRLAGLLTATAAGTALATAVAGSIAGVVGWRLVFLPAVLTAAVAALAMGRLVEPARDAARTQLRLKLAAVARDRRALAVLALTFGEGAAVVGGFTFLASAVQEHGSGAAVAGLVAAGYGAGTMAGATAIRLLPALARGWVAVGTGALVVGFGIAAASQAAPPAAAGALLVGAGYAGLHSTLQTWATRSGAETRAVVVGLFASTLFVGAAVGAAVGALLAGHGAYRPLFAAAAVLSAAVGLAALALQLRWRSAGTVSR